MKPGDWFVLASLTLNAGALGCYAAQGRWPQALYWLGAMLINSAVLWQSLRTS